MFPARTTQKTLSSGGAHGAVLGVLLVNADFAPGQWTMNNWQGVGLSTVAFLFALLILYWIARSPSSDGDS